MMKFVAERRDSSCWSLWEPLIPARLKSEAIRVHQIRKERYRIDSNKDIESQISTIQDATWNIGKQLGGGGSTHNAYLDWYYYVGSNSMRNFSVAHSIHDRILCPFHVEISLFSGISLYSIYSLPLLIIAAMKYAHPYIWLKYIWYVFGLATAVMIHPDFNKSRKHRAYCC
jgi:hypothetical protein